MSRLSRPLLLLVAVCILTGCTPGKTKGLLNTIMAPKTLRVGIAVDSPPLAFKKESAVTGLETEFAAGLAKSVAREQELVELPREELAKALLEEKVDIVMAGMTVAEAQQQKLTPTNPYLTSGQTTLVRLSEYDRLGNGTRHLTEPKVRLGVVAGGTADSWLKELSPKGTISRFASAPEGVHALIKGTIDVFIYSLPANFYYASLYIDKGLTPGNIPLVKEELAWAVRPGDDEMLKDANAYLAAIEQRGDLQEMLDRTIPFYRNTAYSPKQ